MDFTEKDYDELLNKLVSAAHAMNADGNFAAREQEGATHKNGSFEVLGSLANPARSRRSTPRSCAGRGRSPRLHSDLTNQLFHIVSSSVFLGCYALAFWDLTTAMWAGLAALFLRQIGHAVLEPPSHDKEATLLGFNTRNKTLILGVYLAIPVAHLLLAPAWTLAAVGPLVATVAQQWFVWTLLVVGGRVAYLMWAQSAWLAMVWFVKLVTDRSPILPRTPPDTSGAPDHRPVNSSVWRSL
jgi:glutamate-1-semialdehyde 2,1-aminomutase